MGWFNSEASYTSKLYSHAAKHLLPSSFIDSAPKLTSGSRYQIRPGLVSDNSIQLSNLRSSSRSLVCISLDKGEDLYVKVGKKTRVFTK